MAEPIEIILTRQLAGYLALPIFVVDAAGDLLFYNEPAENLLGRRFDEAGPMPQPVWSTVFLPREEDGSPIPPEDLPLTIALRERRPAHRTFWITGHDAVQRRLGVTAFALERAHGERLGAIAVFWAADAGEPALPITAPPPFRPHSAEQKPIELILLRRLARSLALPIMIADAQGTMLFFNEAAAPILGRPFADVGELPLQDWMSTTSLYAEDGTFIPPEERPLPRAMREHQAVHRRLRFRGLDGRMRQVQSTVLPLEGHGRRVLGGAVLFWEWERP